MYFIPSDSEHRQNIQISDVLIVYEQELFHLLIHRQGLKSFIILPNNEFLAFPIEKLDY